MPATNKKIRIYSRINDETKNFLEKHFKSRNNGAEIILRKLPLTIKNFEKHELFSIFTPQDLKKILTEIKNNDKKEALITTTSPRILKILNKIPYHSYSFLFLLDLYLYKLLKIPGDKIDAVLTGVSKEI